MHGVAVWGLCLTGKDRARCGSESSHIHMETGFNEGSFNKGASFISKPEGSSIAMEFIPKQKIKKYIHLKISEPEDTDKGPLLGHRAIF